MQDMSRTAGDIANYAEGLRAMNDDELENERYTLKHEARFLGLSTDEISDRLIQTELELHRRLA